MKARPSSSGMPDHRDLLIRRASSDTRYSLSAPRAAGRSGSPFRRSRGRPGKSPRTRKRNAILILLSPRQGAQRCSRIIVRTMRINCGPGGTEPPIRELLLHALGLRSRQRIKHQDQTNRGLRFRDLHGRSVSADRAAGPRDPPDTRAPSGGRTRPGGRLTREVTRDDAAGRSRRLAQCVDAPVGLFCPSSACHRLPATRQLVSRCSRSRR